jgi:hypothetical protein
VTLSKREKYIAIGVAIAVVVLALDQLVFEPLFAQLKAIQNQRTDAVAKMDAANDLFARQRKLRVVWKKMQSGGLKADASSAESQAMHAILDWTATSGVQLTALKPERSMTQGQFQVISFHVTATGSMATVSRLLWAIETASIPVRVNDVQITPQPEGTDHLSVQLSVSTLCMLNPIEKPVQTAMADFSGGRP